ncbi:DUF3078 domain-containing protein [Salinimicrobium sp. TH3]|uniref:DUF3078 domain-containing protein n=1 Tax=Salinimicrobium sp. TH3 TaxID=2997342 RepID=UPI0022757F1C|nr:DUF3078 domain-containing protein [Salinimicrobium sp. TH3]MCY2686330.1 DUF3078 domain-containing protein [Salinimicrobium sp. TH3]
MKRVLLSVFIFIGFFANAQEKGEAEEQKEGWTTEGNIQLLFNQSAFNKEWAGGGTSSLAGNLTFDYSFNYLMDDITWDNKVWATYGLTKVKTDEFIRKTNDRFEINSIVGKQIKETNWFYSFFAHFQSQFDSGYVFSEDPDTGEITRTETSHFFSPAYLKAGPGIGWHKSDDLHFNIAPATSRFIFVDGDFTNAPGYVDGSYYGVDKGETMRFEFGASLTGYGKFKLIENVILENTLSLYSNYLDKPGNIDLDYLMNLNMSINKFLSANLIFQAIYDDNTIGAFQIREVFGAAVTYNF